MYAGISGKKQNRYYENAFIDSPKEEKSIRKNMNIRMEEMGRKEGIDMLKNNIISNPIGWAEKAVGTNSRYRLLILLEILFGITSGIMIVFSFLTESITSLILMLAFIIYFTAGSLMLVKGMRSVFVKMKEYESEGIA